MKLLVAVPSKGRASLLHKNTYRWLSLTNTDWKYFIEPQEFDKYDISIDHKVALPENNKGLGYSLNFIKQYALEHGYTHVFKVDDDVISWNGKTRRRDKLNSHTNFEQIITDCEEMLAKHPEIKAVGFPYRWEMWKYVKWAGINKRLQSCYLIQTDCWWANPDILNFEDFAEYLHLRVNNHIVARYGYCAMDTVDVGTNKGGAQSFARSMKSALITLGIMQQIYPALRIKKVKKPWGYEPNLTGGIFANRQKI